MGNITEDLHGLYDFKSDYFDMGPVIITKGMRNLVGQKFDAARFVIESIMRYCRKDWGDVTVEDALINEKEISRNDCNMSLFAFYKSAYGKIYISTNRSSEKTGEYGTTVYLPGER